MKFEASPFLPFGGRTPSPGTPRSSGAAGLGLAVLAPEAPSLAARPWGSGGDGGYDGHDGHDWLRKGMEDFER